MQKKNMIIAISFFSLILLLTMYGGKNWRPTPAGTNIDSLVQSQLDDTLLADHSQIVLDSSVTISPSSWRISYVTNGYYTRDSAKVMVDSVQNDHVFILNYKTVPRAGLYMDTIITPDEEMRVVSIWIIYNQELVGRISFDQPLPTRKEPWWYSNDVMPAWFDRLVPDTIKEVPHEK